MIGSEESGDHYLFIPFSVGIQPGRDTRREWHPKGNHRNEEGSSPLEKKREKKDHGGYMERAAAVAA